MRGENSGGGYISRNKEKRSNKRMSEKVSFNSFKPFCFVFLNTLYL